MLVAASLKQPVDRSDKGKGDCDSFFGVIFNAKAHVNRGAVAVPPKLAVDVFTLRGHCIDWGPWGCLVDNNSCRAVRRQTLYRR